MIITLKFDAPIDEWSVIPEGTKLEVCIFDEYSGFTGVIYNGLRYYLNNEYFVEVPSLITN